jgi:hypothetical protein
MTGGWLRRTAALAALLLGAGCCDYCHRHYGTPACAPPAPVACAPGCCPCAPAQSPYVAGQPVVAGQPYVAGQPVAGQPVAGQPVIGQPIVPVGQVHSGCTCTCP